jgi:ceramide glucosyltransferase
MLDILGLILLSGALVGLVAGALQIAALRRYARAPALRPRGRPPGVSILKPLCGIDDGLDSNLLAFATLHHPEYELILGVKNRDDAAWPVAIAFAARFPGRVRVVEQRGEPGLNPKVNQLITLAAAARHDVLVVSDSNVHVGPDYLDEIVARLQDPRVGMVTHPIVGAGERAVGSLLDHLHLCGQIAPGVVAAMRMFKQDVVVGKSMAIRRADLDALGGFAVVKDVLAEDYLLGKLVGDRLGKRVELASPPVVNVSHGRTLRDFLSRQRRWAVIRRHAVTPAAYLAEPLLNPVLFAAAAALVNPGLATLLAAACVVAARVAMDAVCSRAVGRRFGAKLLAAPIKDLLLGALWFEALFRSHVSWRGRAIKVLPGTWIDAGAPAGTGVGAPPAVRQPGAGSTRTAQNLNSGILP